MTIVSFKGFGGVRLEAEVNGSPDNPSILLLHGGGQTRSVWANVAKALEQAGRYVINLDLRGHGASEWPADGRYDFDAYVEDLRAVLAQLGSRPVVVAATISGWFATVALGKDAATLAAGLVLVDVPTQFDPAIANAIAEEMREKQAQKPQPECDMRVFDRIDGAEASAKMHAAAPTIAVPVLFVRGGLSAFGSSDQATEFVASLPNAESVEVENTGLLVVEDRTETFNGLLLDFLELRQPRGAPEYRTGSDARTLRDAMGCFATGVTIVTAHGPDGAPIGLTANSFTSVSLDPPLLLVCVANTSSSAAALRVADKFAVNVLQIGQQPTSNRFAGKVEERFPNTPWEVGESGAPILTGSLGNFECTRDAVHEAGDHFLLVGRVVKASFEPRRDPLLYFKGKYRRLHFA